MKFHTMPRSTIFVLTALVLTLAGCGGSDRQLYHVTGTVTFDGQPVPAGLIFFEPDVAAGNDGTQGYAEIVDGRFDTSESDKGITGGAYQARIRGYVPPADGAPAKMLFKDYQTPVDLPTADSQQNIDVPADATGGAVLAEPT